MSKAGEQFYVRSVSTVDFVGSLTQNASEQASILVPEQQAISSISSFIIENISVQSIQNLDWDIFIWRGAGIPPVVLDSNTFVDYVSFANNDGKQINGVNQFYYPSVDLEIPYIQSSPLSNKLHCSLVNKSVTSKLAGGAGGVVVQFTCKTIR